MLPITDKDFKRLVEYIKKNYGVNLTYKRTLVESRLSNYLIERGLDYPKYIDTVLSDNTGAEVTQLLNKLTTNLTYFMRESSHFEYFAKEVLPWIEKTATDMDVRIWSAGCSSGQEPYTLAMLVADYFKGKKGNWDTKILATDISQKVLDIAQKGIYSGELIESLPLSWKNSYFIRIDKENYQVADSIKNEVIFAPFNLMEEVFPFRKKFHVIFCRNVMIYFDQATKDNLINKFYSFTETGGYLFIGHSESINRYDSSYKYIMPAVYRRMLDEKYQKIKGIGCR